MGTAAEVLYRPGLEGIIAGETDVSAVLQDSLAYRGYTIEELAEHAAFEEVAYLLLHDDLPNAAQLAAFKAEIDRLRIPPREVYEAIRLIPKKADAMDVLRTGISMLGHFDPFSGDDRAALVGRATHCLAVAPSIIGARLRFLAGQEPLAPQPGLSHAAQTLYLTTGKVPSALHEKILNLTLVLYAEHEFNASTFAARVTTSTLSDVYSAIVSGIGTLKGPLHGGANEEAMKLINRFRSAAEARAWTLEGIQNKARIMGFGHRVYKNGDHRARILEAYIAPLGQERDELWRVEVYHAIKDTMWEQKKIYPNVDYPCGLVYFFMGLPLDIYTPLFVCSRITGWAAHIIEQYTNNRIIRPLSRYTGPATRTWKPLARR